MQSLQGMLYSGDQQQGAIFPTVPYRLEIIGTLCSLSNGQFSYNSRSYDNLLLRLDHIRTVSTFSKIFIYLPSQAL